MSYLVSGVFVPLARVLCCQLVPGATGTKARGSCIYSGRSSCYSLDDRSKTLIKVRISLLVWKVSMRSSLFFEMRGAGAV